MTCTDVLESLDRATMALAKAKADAFTLASAMVAGNVSVEAMTQAELDNCYRVFSELRRCEPAMQYAQQRVEVWEAAIAAVRDEAERR